MIRLNSTFLLYTRAPPLPAFYDILKIDRAIDVRRITMLPNRYTQGPQTRCQPRLTPLRRCCVPLSTNSRNPMRYIIHGVVGLKRSRNLHSKGKLSLSIQRKGHSTVDTVRRFESKIPISV